jgi:hypothetical protein
MSVSKIQAAISIPSLLTVCQMALAVSSGLSKNLCGQWSGHSLQNAHLPTRKTFRMKSQKGGDFGPPRAVTPWKKKKKCSIFNHSDTSIDIKKYAKQTKSTTNVRTHERNVRVKSIQQIFFFNGSTAPLGSLGRLITHFFF